MSEQDEIDQMFDDILKSMKGSPDPAPKPVPTHELLISLSTGTDSRFLHIYTHSADADEWIRVEAGAYGTLFEPTSHDRFWQLLVDKTYIIQEVIDYLNNYNQLPEL